MRSLVPATKQSSRAARSRPSSANRAEVEHRPGRLDHQPQTQRLRRVHAVERVVDVLDVAGRAHLGEQHGVGSAGAGQRQILGAPFAGQRIDADDAFRPARRRAPKNGGEDSRGPRPWTPARRNPRGRRSPHRRRASPPWRAPARWKRERKAPSGEGAGIRTAWHRSMPPACEAGKEPCTAIRQCRIRRSHRQNAMAESAVDTGSRKRFEIVAPDADPAPMKRRTACATMW